MKKYGIRITLPKGDPMALPHLLGENWESFRWYDTEQQRDRAWEEMNQRIPYYRMGDVPSRVLSKVEQ